MIWCLWVTALLAYLRGIAALLAPVEGLYATDKYHISYLSFQDWQRSIANNATALSTGSIMELGRNLSCYVPTVAAKDEEVVEELNEKELEAVLSRNLEEGIEVILNAFTGCISYLSGFWNYEFCSDMGLAQFHGNSKTTSLYYVLGRAKPITADREFQLLYNDFGYYISEILGSGDICDVTGRPRVVEVQYICRPAAGPAGIQWVREVKTCHYEIQVAIPQLCSLELLSKSEDKEVSGFIVCAKTLEEQKISGMTELIGYYKPTFIGNELYLLEPYHEETLHNRTALMYTGEFTLSETRSAENYAVNEKFGSAIGRMLFQHLLLPPDKPPYEVGDKFAWMSEVLDSKGNFLTMVAFNLSSSLAEIIIDESMEFTSPGNFLFYERPKVEETRAEDRLSVEDKLAIIDLEVPLDPITDAEVTKLLENLIGLRR